MSRGLRNVLLAAGGALLAGALVVSYALHRAPRAEADIRVITHGERIDLAAHAVPGKYTVFDFYAVWCPPCRALGPQLERLASRNAGRLAIRKVDIVDWTMPVAEQYGVQELPYLVLYDEGGRQMAAGERVFDELGRLFGEAGREVGRAAERAPAGSL